MKLNEVALQRLRSSGIQVREGITKSKLKTVLAVGCAELWDRL